MSYVSAGDCAEPEAAHELLRGNVAPALWNVALVFALVVDYRLAIRGNVLPRFFEIRALQADVRDPGLRVIVDHSSVVDGAQMMVGIALGDDAKVAVPVRHRFVSHEVVF